jgi:large subunit ribosomal protein L27
MATKKAGGTAKNLRDSNPKYLGIKVNHGEKVSLGATIVRQRGTVYLQGKNVGLSKDHSLFALKEGIVEFKNARKGNFDGTHSTRKMVSVKI